MNNRSLSSHESSNLSPANALKDLIKRRTEKTQELTNLERQIYLLEETYLAGTPHGNIVHGWDGNRERIPQTNWCKFKETDRVFSKSSVTSAAAVNSQFMDIRPRPYMGREITTAHDDGSARNNHQYNVPRSTPNNDFKVDCNAYNGNRSTNQNLNGIVDSEAIIDVVGSPINPQTKLLQRATVVLETKFTLPKNFHFKGIR